MASIEDIRAASYDVCGVVRMVSAGYKAKVTSDFMFIFLLLLFINIIIFILK